MRRYFDCLSKLDEEGKTRIRKVFDTLIDQGKSMLEAANGAAVAAAKENFDDDTVTR